MSRIATKKKHGKSTVAHAVQCLAFERALDAKADFSSHAPFHEVLDKCILSRMLAPKIIYIQTFTMIGSSRRQQEFLSSHLPCCTRQHFPKADIPISASIKAASQFEVLEQLKREKNHHQELEWMWMWMSNSDALRIATAMPAGSSVFWQRSVSFD